MTQRHLIEILQELDPEKGATYLRIRANNALQEFGELTGIKQKTSTVTTVADQIEYAVPSDFVRAQFVFDENGSEAVHSAHYQHYLLPTTTPVWWMKNDSTLILGQTLTSSNQKNNRKVDALDAGLDYTLYYDAYPAELTSANLDDELDIPKAFHRAIEARVAESLMLGAPEERSYFFSVWRDLVRKAKQKANQKGDAGIYNVLIHEM